MSEPTFTPHTEMRGSMSVTTWVWNESDKPVLMEYVEYEAEGEDRGRELHHTVITLGPEE